MGGPITRTEAHGSPREQGSESTNHIELFESRKTRVGGASVRRALPKQQLRTIGAWCLADHFGYERASGYSRMEVGPHPHIGLQTVTWLLNGELVHRDSLGSVAHIRPGQLNLMTAGNGVCHSEESWGDDFEKIHGIQLWIAQPAETRGANPVFEHHNYLPETSIDNATATVLVGSFGDATSSARSDTPLVGAEITTGLGSSVLELKRDFEYGIIVLKGALRYQIQSLVPGYLAYLGTGRDEVTVTSLKPSIFMLLGGVPFRERVVMWWNFVARTREEITQAYRDWQSGSARFGSFDSNLPRIEAPQPPWQL